MIPLECLRREEWAEVTDVVGEPHWVARLAEVGVLVGARIRMLQPGSPCLFQVGEMRLSLRLEEGAQIFVHPALALAASS